ncbi:MAG: helix-turn-helix transcriptional regulator [Leptospirales bacterium]
MELNDEIRMRLKQVIRESKLSQRKFAENIGITPPSLSGILKNKINTVSVTFVKLLEVRYGVNSVWLETGMGEQYNGTIFVVNPDEVEVVLKIRELNNKYKSLLKTVAETLWDEQTSRKDKVKAKKKVAKPIT